MKCIRCGYENPEGQTVCGQCGMPIDSVGACGQPQYGYQWQNQPQPQGSQPQQPWAAQNNQNPQGQFSGFSGYGRQGYAGQENGQYGSGQQGYAGQNPWQNTYSQPNYGQGMQQAPGTYGQGVQQQISGQYGQNTQQAPDMYGQGVQQNASGMYGQGMQQQTQGAYGQTAGNSATAGKGRLVVPNFINMAAVLFTIIAVCLPYAGTAETSLSIGRAYNEYGLVILLGLLLLIADFVCLMFNRTACYIVTLVISAVYGLFFIAEFILTLIDMSKLDASAGACLKFGAWFSLAAAVLLIVSVPIWWARNRHRA